MAAVLFVVRDGGGTAPVEFRVAHRLVRHGHRVRVIGPLSVTHLATGLNFESVEKGDPAYVLDRLEGTDIVVADCMQYGALIAATVRGVPSAALMPTVYLADRLVGSTLAAAPHWVQVRADINAARGRFGLSTVDSVADQILEATRVLVLTSRAFELPDVCPPPNVRYVGPQLDEVFADGWCPQETDQPLVLVSLSTTDQGQLGLLRRLLDALGQLPVRAVVTVGPAVDPAQFEPADNTTLERFVPHSAVLPHAALVVTHAGHGTVMSALRAGVPLVCLPMGRDQYDVAARVRHHGVGVSLSADADTQALADGIGQVLAEPEYARAARRMATAITAQDPDQIVNTIMATAGAPEIRALHN